MDGQRSYPEDQESRWYGAERGYAESQWRGGGDERYRGQEHRVPEQRGGGIGESRYADPGDPENGRYAETGRHGTGDVLSGEPYDPEPYAPEPYAPEPYDPEPYAGSRSRRSERSATERFASDRLGSGRIPEVDARGSGRIPEVDPLGTDRLTDLDPMGGRRVDPDPLGAEQEPRRAAGDGFGAGAADRQPVADRAIPTGATPGADHGPAGDPARSAGLTAYPVIQPARGGPVGADSGPPEPVHPLDQPTGPMPAVVPRLDGPSPADPDLGRRAGVPAGDGVYRTRRPVLAVIYAVLVLIFEVPALRVLLSGMLDDPVSPAHVLSGTFLVCGLPIFAAGLYGLGTGAVSLTEPGRVWLRPPTAYLTVALALFVAAALAVG